MEINTVPFNEKQFLLGLLSVLQQKFGDEQRFIFQHKFSSIDTELLEHIEDLKKHADDIAIKKHISQWFQEAASRKLIETASNEYYKITEKGLDAALKYKHPIHRFCLVHWKYIVTTTLAFIVVVIAVLKCYK